MKTHLNFGILHHGMVRVTNLLKLHILLALSRREQHGYELIRTVSTASGSSVGASQVYPFLAQLKSKRYVRVSRTGDRKMKVYALTAEGKKYVTSLLSRLDDVVDFALKSRLVSCAHCGCEVYRGKYTERVKGKVLHFCCCHCARSYRQDRSVA